MKAFVIAVIYVLIGLSVAISIWYFVPMLSLEGYYILQVSLVWLFVGAIVFICNKKF